MIFRAISDFKVTAEKPMTTGRFLVLFWLLMLTASQANAQQASFSSRTDESLSLALFKSGILNLDKTPSQISVGNPGIADILVLRGTQVHVLAKALGSTNVVFWDSSGRIFATVDIEVTHDLDSLKKKLHDLLPNENIGVHSAQEKLILDGQVSSAINMQAALDLADGFLPECVDAVTTTTDASGRAVTQGGKSTNDEACKKGEVINLMSVGGSQQVMLEVKIAEMSRTFMRNLDTDLNIINFNGANTLGGINGGAAWPNVLVEGEEIPFIPAGVPSGLENTIGPVVDKFDPFTPTIQDKGLFLSRFSGDNYLQVAMEISRGKGLSKILAEPNLTTLTGKPAKFISGGEFPIAVVTDDGVKVTYKEFGVIVDFIPTILDGSRISLDLDIGVSQLAASTNVVTSAGGFPIIEKRGASSTVELSNGQTIGIAGLLQDDLVENFSKLPGLGDIPILGHLFRSQEYLAGKSELVIFVTPHLAKPISPDLIKLPTDSFVPPSDLEFYLLGRMASGKKPEQRSYRRNIEGGFDGVTFGHDL